MEDEKKLIDFEKVKKDFKNNKLFWVLIFLLCFSILFVVFSNSSYKEVPLIISIIFFILYVVFKFIK